jgi:phage-related protein
VQRGFEPSDWKRVRTVGRGVKEIRVSTGDEYRVFYVTNLGGRVYVLHAFSKKTEKTRQADIELGRTRLKDLKRALRDARKRHR